MFNLYFYSIILGISFLINTLLVYLKYFQIIDISDSDFLAIFISSNFILLSMFLFFFFQIKKIEKVYDTQKKTIKKQSNFNYTLMNKAPIAMYYHDLDGVFIDCNHEFEQIIGMEKSHIIGKTILDLLPINHAVPFLQNDYTLIESSSNQIVFETKIINLVNHKITDAIFYKNKLLDEESKNIIGIVGAISDVTELKEKDLELSKLNKELRMKFVDHLVEANNISLNFESVFNTTKDGMIILDNKFNMIVSNNSFLNLFHIKRDRKVALNLEDFAKRSKNIHLNKILELYKKKGSISKYSIEIQRKNVTHYYIIDMERMKNDNILLVITDISELKYIELEEKDRQKKALEQSKLAQMGELLSMIAHQWRQPLASISTILINIENKLELNRFKDMQEANSFITNKIKNIHDYTQYMSTTIDDFRNFYKKDESLSNISLSELLQDSLKIIVSSLKASGIEVKIDVVQNETVKCYKNEIVQVILNILKNSQDNFIEKKIIDKRINITIFAEEKYSIIRIQDNGLGISPENIDKVFEPYFSTKGEKNGTGIGLYMSKMIIEEHHKGKLSVENIKNGVAFEIKFNKDFHE